MKASFAEMVRIATNNKKIKEAQKKAIFEAGFDKARRQRFSRKELEGINKELLVAWEEK